VLTVEFELAGQTFTALNGGPLFKFTEAISLQVLCDDQAEIDHYWEALRAGGDPEAQNCGWLKDKFGVSWQVAPKRLIEMVSDHTSPGHVMAALFPMQKLDLAALERAYEGK
jgi:predicted 3-demethylubiquinone-9 3-methyltransferase (glyoxalase superfamily)